MNTAWSSVNSSTKSCCYVSGRPLKDYWQGVQPNCCVHIIEILEGKMSVKEMSKSFL